MSCGQAFEIDLAGFLADPRAEAFAAFRDHYPRCPACAAEVGAWTQLERQLRARGADAHPDPALLERYEAGGGIEALERARVERHLAGCASCRDELRALRGFDPERMAPARARPLRAGLAALGRLAWSPAFAYAVLALVLLPTIYRALGPAAPGLGRRPPAVLSESDAPFSDRADAPRAAEPKQERVVGRAMAPMNEALRKARSADDLGAEALALPASPPAGAALREAPGAQATSQLRAEAADVAPQARASRPKAAPLQMAFEQASDRVQLRAGAPVTVALAAARGGLWLLAPLPPGLAPGEAEIRLSDAAGRRELRERVAAPDDASEITLRAPAGWLEPGSYRVALHSRAAGPGEAPRAVFFFRVDDAAP